MIQRGVILTPMKRFKTDAGDVLRVLRCEDEGFAEFGEAYFTWVDTGAVKAWKRHNVMIMNLIVPLGGVKFVFSCDLKGPFHEQVLDSDDNYYRLTVPPGVWFGFKNITSKPSLVLNIASIVHDPNEVDRISLDEIKYDWSSS